MTILFKICVFLISTLTYAQEVDFTGTYYWEINPTNAGKHSRTLTVNSDGTFHFTRFRAADRLNPISHIYGKGSWSSQDKYIYFTSDPEKDIDQKHTLNFTNTKGRWDAKNSRLILYGSDIFWLKRFVITKQSN